jgi:hypothetical protein
MSHRTPGGSLAVVRAQGGRVANASTDTFEHGTEQQGQRRLAVGPDNPDRQQLLTGVSGQGMTDGRVGSSNIRHQALRYRKGQQPLCQYPLGPTPQRQLHLLFAELLRIEARHKERSLAASLRMTLKIPQPQIGRTDKYGFGKKRSQGIITRSIRWSDRHDALASVPG